ncbi:MAG: methyltransferase [Gammaproteobacteria bacterium]|nr:methyltransferase [Gammaproteobacteria bacterium]
MKNFVLALALIVSIPMGTAAADALEDAVNNPQRTAAYTERDQYRNPLETLRFFGVQPDMTVAEIWASPGWYAEILAPYLKADGKYYAVGFSLTAKRTPQWRRNMANELIAKFDADPGNYSALEVTSLSVPEDTVIAPPGTIDVVLTFRNVHNWMKGEYAPGVFAAMYAALRPGGILGVVEHRAAPGTSVDMMEMSGYVTEAQVIEFAEAAGFVFEARSEVNANPKDTKDYPRGVWTLPPSLRMKDVDREKYLAIGESDRMALKFRKP